MTLRFLLRGDNRIVRQNARTDRLTTVEMTDHIRALWMRDPSVGHVHEIMAMLPHSLRYDVVDGKVLCPYQEIVDVLTAWTPIDGTNQYTQDGAGLVDFHDARPFALRHVSRGLAPEVFANIWRRELPAILKDVAYIQSWYAKRERSLRTGEVYEKHETISGTWRHGQPVKVRRTTEYRGRCRVVYDPTLDRCDPKKWYVNEKMTRDEGE